MNFMRVSWGMSALVWFAVIVLCCVFWGWWASLVAVIFGLFPDVALIGAFAGEGRLKPSRVRLYNTLHTMTYPIVLLVVGLIVFLTTGALDGGFWPIALAGVAWFVHIAADRALGFGLRAPDGSIIPVGYQLS
ncbi:DUF4260 family protein [Leucobacter celer]|uniref:DUF4260 family protein n=1 Tax=Leucobacter celer TaxID=668625 RepID=UPI0006A7DFBC|nr:DUF4260 family protein [Leucobacter celer]